MKVLFAIDATDHWHAAAKAVGRFVAAAGGEVAILAAVRREKARRTALEAARRLLDLSEGALSTKIRRGFLETALAEAAREETFDLVVVPPLGMRDTLTGGHLRSTIARRVHASTLLLRRGRGHPRRILVCTQGPLHGLDNLEAASTLARVFEAEITVLHVASAFPLTAEATAEMERLTEHFLETDTPEARHLREVEQSLARRGLAGRLKVRFGVVVDEILDEVVEGKHDLLVVGAHHPTRDDYLLADVTGNVVRDSPVSTLVVRKRA
ncbi:MAG TPA: universal stress protein [Candidatus Thermoplasmatota archaeon]|nr:universal stress protein [Candidatus Thermoplasmatota archaeon]